MSLINAKEAILKATEEIKEYLGGGGLYLVNKERNY